MMGRSIRGLLDLPDELILMIAILMEPEELGKFVKVCKRVFGIADTLLYRFNVKYDESDALIWAARSQQEQTFRRLLDERTHHVQTVLTPINSKDYVDMTQYVLQVALVMAAKSGCLEIVKLAHEHRAALEIGCELRCGTDSGRDLRFWTIREESLRKTDWMGVRYSRDLSLNGTALHIASESGHSRVVKWLLRAGATVYAPVDGMNSALDRALGSDHVRIVSILLQHSTESVSAFIPASYRETIAPNMYIERWSRWKYPLTDDHQRIGLSPDVFFLCSYCRRSVQESEVYICQSKHCMTHPSSGSGPEGRRSGPGWSCSACYLTSRPARRGRHLT